MIPKRYEFIVFAFFMSMLMSFLMSGVITWINIGMVDNFLILWTEAFFKAYVVAFPSVIIVVPQVKRLVRLVIKEE